MTGRRFTPRLLLPLRHRGFRALFTGVAISSLGDWLDQIALLVLVSVVWHRGAAGLASIVIAAMAPALAAPLFGVFVDRYPQRPMLFAAQSLQAVATLGLVVAPNVGAAAAIVFIRSTLGTVVTSGSQALIRKTVPDEDLVSANALTQTAIQASKIVGPALGGLLIVLLSPHTVFLFNAVSFAIGAAAVYFIPQQAPAGSRAGSSYFGDLRAGFQHVLGTKALRTLVIVMAALMFVVFLYDSMAALVVIALGMDKSYIGYLISAVGIGGILGAVALGQRGRITHPFRLISASVAIIGALVMALGGGVRWHVHAPAPLWLALTFVLGLASAGVLVTLPTVVQTSTPGPLMGRVWATMSAIPAAFNVLAPATAALLVGAVGLGPLFLGAGGCLILLAAAVAAGYGRLTLEPPAPAALPADASAPDSHTPESPLPDPLPAAGSPQAPVVPTGSTPPSPRKEMFAMSEKTELLAAAGFPVESASPAQVAVLESLSSDELRVLQSVKSRVEAAASDVQGHTATDDPSSGGYFW